MIAFYFHYLATSRRILACFPGSVNRGYGSTHLPRPPVSGILRYRRLASLYIFGYQDLAFPIYKMLQKGMNAVYTLLTSNNAPGQWNE
jgi:hypothetical protein